ncbi:MAG: hypothetical protein ACRCWM_09035 [Sarcina sp.]
MSYPMRTTDLFNVSDSIDNIASSEASILQGLNEILCTQFVTPLLSIAVTDPNSASFIDPADRLTIMANLLNTMATKECTVASVLNAAANVIVINKGLISPAPTTSDDFSCTPCNNCK